MTAITDGELAGLEAVLNYNSASHATPTWVTITRAKDVSVTATRNMADVSSRISNYKYKVPGLMELAIEFGYMYRRGTDAVFTALQAAFAAATKTEFWAGDGAITLTGCRGYRMYAIVSEFSADQPLEDGVTYKVKLDLTPNYISSSLQEPDFYSV